MHLVVTNKGNHLLVTLHLVCSTIMITEKNHKLLTSQLFVTDCTKKGLASMDNLNYSLNQVCDLVELRDNLKYSLIYVHVLYNYFI